jgi:hypothetical protein
MRFGYSIAILLLVFGSKLSAQSNIKKAYRCVFTDTVSLVLPDTFYKSFAVKMAQERDLPDSIVEDLAEKLKFAMVAKSPRQIHLRMVFASQDSTSVQFGAVDNHLGGHVPLPYKQMTIKNGREIVRVIGEDNSLLELPDIGKREFVLTGRVRTIMGHSCSEYAVSDNTVTIWVAKSLPSWINPGIAKVNVDGAILAFKMRRDGEIITSVLTKIE